MKEQYENTKIEIIYIESDDVIRTSLEDGEGEKEDDF